MEFLCLALSKGSGEKFAAFSVARAVGAERNRTRVSKTTQNEKRKYNLRGKKEAGELRVAEMGCDGKVSE